jgi:microcompartment protein CcmL/EutN
MRTCNLAIVEVLGLSPALVIADAAVKAADVKIVGVESDAGQMAVIKMVGDAANCRRALEAAQHIAEQMHARFKTALCLNYCDAESVRFVESDQEYSPINEAFQHMLPKADAQGINMQALGLLETQGLIGVIEGADVMLKAADVELIGKEKIGAAHVTVMIRGDVAAVTAAIEAGKAAAEKVGTLVAAHVIARPHEGLAKLLPQ